MDTVKLDIQKLQLLNDRIAQTLEALNQVRLSVHGLQSGLQHSSAIPSSPWGGTLGGGVGGAMGMGPGSVGSYVPFGQNPFVQGFQHTGIPYAPQQPFVGPIAGFVSPAIGYGPAGLQHSGVPSGVPFVPFGAQLGLGMIDPTWQIRAAQTFPFAQLPYPQTY